jgi:hypothetical protein
MNGRNSMGNKNIGTICIAELKQLSTEMEFTKMRMLSLYKRFFFLFMENCLLKRAISIIYRIIDTKKYQCFLKGKRSNCNFFSSSGNKKG